MIVMTFSHYVNINVFAMSLLDRRYGRLSSEASRMTC